MRINSFRMTYPVILGIPFMHILVFGLCGFFVNRFIIESYDPSVYILLVMLLACLLICDVGLIKYQLFHRCYLKFQMDQDGIEWYLLKRKVQRLNWAEVRTYGVTGYDIKNPESFVFFSRDPNEKCETMQMLSLGRQRIVIQIRKESLCLLEQNLPSEMRKILVAIDNKQDCYYRKHNT